jgi:hypothetical protein
MDVAGLGFSIIASIFDFSYTQYSDCENIYLDVLTDLNDLSPPNTEK